MTAKQLLQTVRSERFEIVILQEQIEELRMSLLPGAVRYDKDKVQTSPEDTLSEIVSKLDEYERKLRNRLLLLLEHQSEVSDMITQLINPDERQVLQLYYLDKDRLYWTDVADLMHLSEQRIYQIHNDAIAHLEKTRVN